MSKKVTESDNMEYKGIFNRGDTMTDAKKSGRPRKYTDEKAKIRAWRRKQEGQRLERRLDIYVDNKASWRLKMLSLAWGCSLAGAVERLAKEADEKYEDILFPETKE